MCLESRGWKHRLWLALLLLPLQEHRWGGEFHLRPEGLPGSSAFYTSLALSPFDPDILLVVGNGNTIYRTTNGGDSWNAVTGNFSRTSKRFQFSASNPQIVWAATTSSEINVSTDAGQHFAGVSTPPDAPNSTVLGFGMHPERDSTVFVTFGVSEQPKVFRSDDLGSTWVDITNNLPDVPVYAMLVMPFDTSRFWLGTDIGLFESLDAGATWAYAANGIPAVSIRKLKIVGQEIVAATHGRGIWSVHLDELPPLQTPVQAPLLADLAPPPPNQPRLAIHFNTRSDHDSIHVMVNDSITDRFGTTSAYSEQHSSYLGAYGDSLTVQVVAFNDGFAYASESQFMIIYAPLTQVLDSFDDGTSSLVFGDLHVSSFAGFSSDLLQSPHPYASGQNYIGYVGPPVIMDESTLMSYRDVAIVEPGEPGSEYPQNTFWDYVTVEGTLDGIHWDVLIEPYDCRYDEDWRGAYIFQTTPTADLFRDHEISLGDFYASGDTVGLRFRLFADEAVTGWGWAIDDLVIQSTVATNNAPVSPQTFALLPNFPNPFNGATTLSFTVAQASEVSLAIFDLRGRQVRQLLNREGMETGQVHTLVWNGLDDQGRALSTGLYILRMDYPGGGFSRKLTLLK